MPPASPADGPRPPRADRPAFTGAVRGWPGGHAHRPAPPHLALAPGFGGRAEEVVQDRELRAEERALLLHDVLLQQRGDLVTEERLVVLPDLPLHLHRTGPVQLLVSHHQLQLLLRNLHNPQATVSSTLLRRFPSRQLAGLSSPTAETTSNPAQLTGTAGTGPPGCGTGSNHRQLFPRRGSTPRSSHQASVSARLREKPAQGAVLRSHLSQDRQFRNADQREPAGQLLPWASVSSRTSPLAAETASSPEKSSSPGGPPVSYTWENSHC